MRFELTTLGCSSALPTVSKYPTAHVLNVREQFFLIDCGEGVQRQLKKYGINILKINQIFISHLHGDHVYGLFGLISTMGLLGRTRVLEIFAPAPMQQIIDNHLRFFDNHLPYKIVCRELNHKSNEEIQLSRYVKVESFPLKHSVATVGYRFSECEAELNIHKWAIERYAPSIAQMAALKRGEDITLGTGQIVHNSEVAYRPYTPRSFAYCCDTCYSPNVVEAVRGVDLLLHEATYRVQDQKDARKRQHSTTQDAARVALEAEVGELVLTHFSVRYKEPVSLFEQEAREVFPRTTLAKEGRVVSVAQKRFVRHCHTKY